MQPFLVYVRLYKQQQAFVFDIYTKSAADVQHRCYGGVEIDNSFYVIYTTHTFFMFVLSVT